MGRNQVYCCICGAPFLEAGQSTQESGDWLSHSLILTTGHRTNNSLQLDSYLPNPGQYACDLGSNPAGDSSARVLPLVANYDDNNRFFILELGCAVDAFSVPLEGGPLCLAVHKLCYQLSERFISSRMNTQHTLRRPSEDEISSTEKLWEVLYRRMPGSSLSPEYILPDPYEYHGGRGCRNVYWDVDDDPEDGQLLESDPMEISGLTESILGNLLRATSERPEGTETKTDDTSQQANQSSEFAHSQDWWCDALANKTLLPWLWDLNAELIREKQRDGSWDWELLVRKLSHVKLHESGDTTLSLPLGLRNRRRIWRCLEDGRVDDVAREMPTPRH
ncbi:hypothetical protein F4777DRAFT_573055 [Nemania sp. FL0916]|nr:hypothetical protein F4777DRAFT_573055 [Nemania sp. FL0916]